ncbi:MAG: hypothetical protein HYY06_27810 [Deltaproteobacteria bacterium]|nr:hypothetical protein [Deltaproteobacteria bacterium]
MRKIRFLCLAILTAAWGCSGADGAPGEKGDEGPDGERGEKGDDGPAGQDGQDSDPPVAAISAVMPSSVVQGETVAITVLGEDTSFDETTTVDLAGGLTVDAVVAGSPEWLTVTATVALDAEVGGREITVTTGDQVLTLPDGLVVIELAPELSISVDSLAAGQFAYAVISARDSVFNQFTSAEVCSGYDEEGACIAAEDLLFYSVELNDSQHLSFIVQVDAFAEDGSVDFVVNVGGSRYALTVPITPTIPAELAENDIVSGNIEEENGLDAYSFTVDEVGRYTVQITPSDADTFRPHLEIFGPVGGFVDGLYPMIDVLGNLAAINATEAGVYTVVVSDDFNDGVVGGGADGYSYGIQLSGSEFPDLTSDLEDDDTATVAGTILAQQIDIYRLTPSADSTVTFDVTDGEEITALTDSALTLYDAAFVEIAGVDDNWDSGDENLADQALTGGATYYIAVEGPCYIDFFGGGMICGTGDYTLTVTR